MPQNKIICKSTKLIFKEASKNVCIGIFLILINYSYIFPMFIREDQKSQFFTEPRPTDPEGNNINNVPPNIPPRARPPNGVHPLYVTNPSTNGLELRSVQVTNLGSGRFHFHFGPAPLEPRGPTGQPPRPQGGQGPLQNP